MIDWTPDRVRVPYLVPDPWSPGAFKVGHHRSGPETDPDREGIVDPARAEAAEGWARRHVSPIAPAGPPETCLYTNAPDEDFVLDRVGPLVVASPCSGHGFKFAPLFGGVIADLVTGRSPSIDLAPFAAGRPALARGTSPGAAAGVAR
jgi:glycine/D-amino acid oxidase-like deaminating enzyme